MMPTRTSPSPVWVYSSPKTTYLCNVYAPESKVEIRVGATRCLFYLPPRSSAPLIVLKRKKMCRQFTTGWQSWPLTSSTLWETGRTTPLARRCCTSTVFRKPTCLPCGMAQLLTPPFGTFQLPRCLETDPGSGIMPSRPPASLTLH